MNRKKPVEVLVVAYTNSFKEITNLRAIELFSMLAPAKGPLPAATIPYALALFIIYRLRKSFLVQPNKGIILKKENSLTT